MSITLATGTQVAIPATYGAGFTITGITNANPAVATLSASHGVAVGDIIEVSSGWDLLNGRLVRVSALATNDATLEGINTTDTGKFPASSGAGTGREILTWASITQIQGIDTSGGDLSFADITTIADRTQKQVPTTRSAQQITFTFFDDPSLPWYATAAAASDAASLSGLRIIFPGGSRLLASGYLSLQKTPNVAVNAPLTAQLGFSAYAEPIRYAT